MRDGYLQAIDKHLSDQMVDRDIKAILRIKRSEMRSIYELKLNKKPLMREKVYSLLHKIAKPFILDKEC
jgi:hypothetical protein